ncbi:MAG: hypothetical protein PHC53_03450 [Patescibacteria group bacterium]|nr:hypothetical protein [Patescibacteria group bacterium]
MNRFERPQPFSLRAAPLNPFRYVEQAQKEAARQAEALRLADVKTVFDVKEYFKSTGRPELCPDIATFDKAKVDMALLDDLAEAESKEQTQLIRELRAMSFTAAKRENPRPEVTVKQVKELIMKELADTNTEIIARKAAGDDIENESTEFKNWSRLMGMVARREDSPEQTALDEPAIRFLEGELTHAYGLFEAYRQKGSKFRPQEMLDRLKKIREAVYWRFLHPDIKLSNE